LTRRTRRALAGGAAVVLLSACGGSPEAADSRLGSGGAPSPSPTPVCVPAPLSERVAQTLVVGLPGVTDPADPLVAELRQVGVGGVLLTKTNVAGTEQVLGLVAALRAGAPHGLLVTADEEPGRVSSFRDLIGSQPSPRALAAERTPEQVRDVGREMGESLARFGVDADLAPTADLDAGDPAGIIGNRSFSADPATATRYTLAFSAGLDEAGVLPTVKHFPGHGRSATDSHLALDNIDTGLAELEATDLVPFQASIDAGVPLVMTGHVAYDALDPALPASLTPATYELLRDMGFEGVAITDSLGMGAVNLRWDFPEAAVMAVTAGADAILATHGDRAAAMRDALVAAVAEGRLSEERVDEAATRVLRLKGRDPRPVTCAE
jgi:beta-N-acetylhexosaminidase